MTIKEMRKAMKNFCEHYRGGTVEEPCENCPVAYLCIDYAFAGAPDEHVINAYKLIFVDEKEKDGDEKMTRKEALEAAIKTVCADRQDQYGEPERNLGNIAAMWSVYLDCNLSAKDVAAMMALLKICRIATGKPKSDNWIDLAGYAAIGAEAEEETTHD